MQARTQAIAERRKRRQERETERVREREERATREEEERRERERQEREAIAARRREERKIAKQVGHAPALPSSSVGLHVYMQFAYTWHNNEGIYVVRGKRGGML